MVNGTPWDLGHHRSAVLGKLRVLYYKVRLKEGLRLLYLVLMMKLALGSK